VSIASADIQKAIVTRWNASGLNDEFTGLGGSAPVLLEQEQEPGTTYPYCVMELPTTSVAARMSATTGKRQIRDIGQTFHVFAGVVDGDSRSAKQIAAYLAEELMKVYGGHPTNASDGLTLDNGNVLIVQYVTDYGTRIGDDEYQWTVEYNIRIDVPVMV